MLSPSDRSEPGEIDDDGARLTLPVGDGQLFAIALLQLAEQGQRIVVVAETHRLAGLQRIQRTENRRVTETLGNAAGIERVERFGGSVVAGVAVCMRLLVAGLSPTKLVG